MDAAEIARLREDVERCKVNVAISKAQLLSLIDALEQAQKEATQTDPAEPRGYIDPDNGQYVGPHPHIPSPRQPNPPSEDEDFSGCAISKRGSQ